MSCDRIGPRETRERERVGAWALGHGTSPHGAGKGGRCWRRILGPGSQAHTKGRPGAHRPWLHKFRGLDGSFVELLFLDYKRQLTGMRCFTLPYSVIIVFWCSWLSRAPLILRQWPSTSPDILHGTDVGSPFPHRLFQKTFRRYVRALSWPWLGRPPSITNFRSCPR
ncbi:hypothetical protein Cgig2_025450 [Carnegiea gigantea]|uniref:Uncharacterized protein n=1 Tax=Carnegiea gigantea TaxID=171969 RepID=A0A9Q1H0Q4_9CARY|nr:hypothetical protein Cgig2_025450 [Carnegiea gigantea]